MNDTSSVIWMSRIATNTAKTLQKTMSEAAS